MIIINTYEGIVVHYKVIYGLLLSQSRLIFVVIYRFEPVITY